MKSVYFAIPIFLLIICACTSQYKVAGWYHVADYPDNTIIGKPLATVKDFEWVVLKRDTFVIERDTLYLHSEKLIGQNVLSVSVQNRGWMFLCCIKETNLPTR